MALAVVSAFAGYLLVGNALLNTPFARQLANRQPQKFVAAWQSAWTLYPGDLRVTNLAIAGHVRHTVWSVQAATVRGRIDLLALLHKEIRVARVLADGVSGGVSIIDKVRQPADPRPGGWTLRFDDILVSGLRQAYFNDLVLRGTGEARSAFVKTTRGGPMEVLPSRVAFSRGRLWQDGREIAWNNVIRAEFAIARHRRVEAPGIRKLQKLDLDLRWTAQTAGLLIAKVDAGKPVLQLTPGPGQLDVTLGWRRGAIASGSRVLVAVPTASDVAGGHDSTMASVSLQADEQSMRLQGGIQPIEHTDLEAAFDLTIRGTSVPVTDFAALLPRASGQVHARWHFASLAWIAELLPGRKPFQFDGAGTVIADAKIQDGEIAAGSSLEVPQVSATVRALGNRFDGDASARVTFSAARRDLIEPHLTAVMQQFRAAPDGAPQQAYLLGRDLRIDALASGDPRTLNENVKVRVKFRDARVPNLSVYNRYLPTSNVRIEGGEGRLSGDLRFDSSGGVASGELEMTGRGVKLGLAGLRLQGELQVDTKLRRAEVAAHRFVADGSRLSLRNMQVSSGEESLGSGWWGEFELDRARLDWHKPMTLDGRLNARMKDVGVLLAIYARKKELPSWIGRMIDHGEVGAEGRLQWRDRTLLLEPFAASNDRFDVRARLKLRDKQATGDLLANWGAMSIGVALEPGRKKDVHVVNARRWYESQPALEGR